MSSKKHLSLCQFFPFDCIIWKFILIMERFPHFLVRVFFLYLHLYRHTENQNQTKNFLRFLDLDQLNYTVSYHLNWTIYVFILACGNGSISATYWQWNLRYGNGINAQQNLILLYRK